MKLNACERLLASSEVIAPSTSFRDDNEADLQQRQGESFKERESSGQRGTKSESAYTPAFKPEWDSADTMYASSDEEEVKSGGGQSELEVSPTKLSATLSTLSFLINADSTAMTENPFPMVHDFPSDQMASSTHDNGMNLEAAPCGVEMMEARSTHGMDILSLVENQPDNPELISARNAIIDRLKASVDPGSTANDNINPYPDKIYPVTDGYLDAKTEEVDADINPSMFGNASQPLGGMGG